MIENNKPAIEQWKELYDAAINIRQIAPWDHLWDMNLIIFADTGTTKSCIGSCAPY
jgi:hypothetical protein